jgi:hypothetical protein
LVLIRDLKNKKAQVLLPKPLLFSALQHPNTINRLINRDLAGVAKKCGKQLSKAKIQTKGRKNTKIF